MSLSVEVVIPCYNPGPSLCHVVEQVCAILENQRLTFRICLVDDGSASGFQTLFDDLSKDSRVTVVYLARNAGQPAATIAGLRETTADVVLCMDDDGESDVGQVLSILHGLSAGADACFASKPYESGMSIRGFGSRMNRLLQRRQFGDVLAGKLASGFTLSTPWGLQRHVVNAVCHTKNARPYLAALIFSACRSITVVQSTGRELDKLTRTRYTVRRRIRLWSDALYGHTVIPLRIVAFGAGILAISFVAVAVYIVRLHLSSGTPVPGYSSLLLAITFTSLLTTTSSVILAGYVARMFEILVGKGPYVLSERLPLFADAERNNYDADSNHAANVSPLEGHL